MAVTILIPTAGVEFGIMESNTWNGKRNNLFPHLAASTTHLSEPEREEIRQQLNALFAKRSTMSWLVVLAVLCMMLSGGLLIAGVILGSPTEIGGYVRFAAYAIAGLSLIFYGLYWMNANRITRSLKAYIDSWNLRYQARGIYSMLQPRGNNLLTLNYRVRFFASLPPVPPAMASVSRPESMLRMP